MRSRAPDGARSGSGPSYFVAASSEKPATCL